NFVKQQQLNINAAPGETRHSVYAKNDIIQMLNQGLTLRSSNFHIRARFNKL
ncbi:unnamed protein product, partial [Rotaria sordida]